MYVEIGIKKKMWSDGLKVTMNNVAKSSRGGKANTWKKSFIQLPPVTLTEAFLGSKACLAKANTQAFGKKDTRFLAIKSLYAQPDIPYLNTDTFETYPVVGFN